MRIIVIIYTLLSISYSLSFADNKLTDEVYSKLLATLEQPENFTWPPIIEVKNDTSMFATSIAYYDEKEDKFGFKINLSMGILNNLVRNDKNILAFILGHELAHIKHKNHSKYFWAHLDKFVGNAKKLRKKMKNYRLPA